MNPVRARRLISYLNVFLSVAVIGLLAVGYLLLFRPLPQTTGTLKAPLAAKGRIVRDDMGVPHITANAEDDMFFLQGYVTAQDRMHQMDLIRRVVGGELSEVAGPERLEQDKAFRLLGIRRAAEAAVPRLTPEVRRAFAAYARGVNFYLQQNRGSLPAEFTLMGYDPKPWRIEDSLLVGFGMYLQLTKSDDEDLAKQDMLQTGDRAKVERLTPARLRGDSQPGSNAFVLSGKYTQSGKPLLANDTHLQYRLPATWYMLAMKGPEGEVTGFTLPGVPSVVIGHNARIAWGITNSGFDVQDLYVESLSEDGRFSRTANQVLPVREIVEWIAVKGRSPVRYVTRVTAHGPLVSTKPAVALRWTATEPGAFQFPFLKLMKAGTWDEFRNALRDFSGPSQNFAYADIDGNIGYQLTGWLPIRNGFCGDRLLNGSTGQQEWQGYIPFEELPSVYNPPSGRIVTANQDPFPTDYKYTVCGSFASLARYQQIQTRLQAKPGFQPVDMLQVQTDVYSRLAQFVLQQVTQGYVRSNRHASFYDEAARLAEDFNGQMEVNSAGAALAVESFNLLRERLGNAAGPNLGAKFSTFQLSPAVVEEMLRERPQGWFANWDEMLDGVFRQACDEIAKDQGRDTRQWKWGWRNAVNVPHPVLSVADKFGWFSGRLNIGPDPMSGWTQTVKQVRNSALGPSMRFVADLGDWENSLANITIGQSGHVASRHYRDQWDLYYSGRSLPMRFRKVRASETLEVEPR